MRIKDKLIKDKQMTDRPQASLKNTDSTPVISSLQRQQYFYYQPNLQKTSRDTNFTRSRVGQKENYVSMVNSVPIGQQYMSHNVIKIDNYENKRFKTQQGYEPMMTKSRYMGERDDLDQHYESTAVYKSSQNIVLRREKVKKQERIFDSIDLTEAQRPLTFGLIRKTQPLKSSVEYQQDIKMRNQILNEMSSLRKSQQTLIASKDYSASAIGDLPRCVNHNNKKAKYRLLTDSDGKEEEDMIYCSKCAINLLQQGFKVEEIKQEKQLGRKLSSTHLNFICHQGNKNMLGSVGSSSRLQQMRQFEQRLSEVQNKINYSLQQSSYRAQEIEEIERQIEQRGNLYDQMIQYLHQMKNQEVTGLQQKKNKRIINLQAQQKQLSQELQNIQEMKKEMNEFRNKFIIMKQNQFQFLISSFLNKIKSYGQKYKQNQIPPYKIDDQINQIIIDLCEYCKQIKEQDQQPQNKGAGFAKNKKKQKKTNWNEQSEDEFICKEIKGPFRTLFPEEESNPPSQRKLQCEEFQPQQDSPSFNRYEANERLDQNSRKSSRVIDIFRH